MSHWEKTILRRTTSSIIALPLLLGILVFTLALPAAAEGPNLLVNGGFERPYVALPDKENCRIAAPWVAWWVQGSPEEAAQGYRFAPEYKAAFREDFPGNRVRSGELAQQYFHSWGNFEGGVWQQVKNIPTGSRLRFELWGMTWSCDREDKGNCGGATSGDPSPMHFRIGIDPNGGVDPFNPAIVWSPEQNAYDAWAYFVVEATAKSTVVTVFVYAYPEFRSQDNNVYLDDASLTIVTPPSPTPAPTRKATSTPRPTVTSTGTATATPRPTPTATLTPTLTSTATPTGTSTATPTANPTATPTATPTANPTATPTDTPLAIATAMPSDTPAPALATSPPTTQAPTTKPGQPAPVWGSKAALFAGVGIVAVLAVALGLYLRGRP